jgi:hypothetical protein
MRIFRWQFLGVADFDKVVVFLVSKRFGHGMSHVAEKKREPPFLHWERSLSSLIC